MTQSVLEVHQTLHGYGDEGHQLLRSSARLSSAHESQLLLLSDLSGPEFQPNFDGYLTGYGLNGSGYYVVARTWFASEMPRPGCVWTHSLLFRDEDLSRIRELDALPFRKPTGAETEGTYSDPLRLTLDEDWPGIEASPEIAGALSALYSTDATVVVSATSASEHEQGVLAIFLQQWPKLRRSFRFCTGALLPRDRSFDLVVAPREALLGVERRQGFVVVAHEGARARSNWVAGALTDLRSPDHDYRLFLWRFGPDFANGRRAFAFLTRIYHQLSRCEEEQVDVTAVLDDLQRIAPSPTDAQRLKATLFGKDATFSAGADERVIRWLLREGSSCLDTPTAAIETRVQRLAGSAPGALADILLGALQGNGGPLVADFESACVAAVRSRALDLRSWKVPELVRLLTIDPELISHSEIWERPADQQGELLQLVAPAVVAATARVQLQATLLRAGMDVPSELAFKYWPTEGLSALLSVLNDDQRFMLPHQARLALLHNHDRLAAIVGEGQLAPRALRFCAAHLDVSSAAVRSIPIVMWFPCARSGVRLDERSLELKACVLFLVMALRATEVDASRLVAEAFMCVHDAAGAETIGYAEWQLIDREIPIPSYWWDRCKWLVRALVDRFVARAWSKAEFVATFPTEVTWRRAVRHLRRSRTGETYLDDLRRAHDVRALSLDAKRAALLYDNPWW